MFEGTLHKFPTNNSTFVLLAVIISKLFFGDLEKTFEHFEKENKSLWSQSRRYSASRLFDIPADYFGRINPVSIFQQDSYLVLATSQELSNSETAKQYISFMQNKQRQRCLLLVLNNEQADKGWLSITI